MDLISEALHVNDREIRLAVRIGPASHQRIAVATMLQHFLVGAQVEVITQRLRLDGRHVSDVLSDLFFVVMLACAWKRSRQPAIWKAGWVIDYYFAEGDSTVLEAHAVTALEDPTLKLIIPVLQLAARLDPKELWMHSSAIQEHRVGVGIGGLGWINVGFEWVVHSVFSANIRLIDHCRGFSMKLNP